MDELINAIVHDECWEFYNAERKPKGSILCEKQRCKSLQCADVQIHTFQNSRERVGVEIA